MEQNDELTRQLLQWLAESQRSYVEAMDAWRTTCPRLTVWEDAVNAGLARVRDGIVEITEEGKKLLVSPSV